MGPPSQEALGDNDQLGVLSVRVDANRQRVSRSSFGNVAGDKSGEGVRNKPGGEGRLPDAPVRGLQYQFVTTVSRNLRAQLGREQTSGVQCRGYAAVFGGSVEWEGVYVGLGGPGARGPTLGPRGLRPAPQTLSQTRDVGIGPVGTNTDAVLLTLTMMKQVAFKSDISTFATDATGLSPDPRD